MIDILLNYCKVHHFLLVPVTINQRKGYFLLDTGASQSCLHQFVLYHLALKSGPAILGKISGLIQDKEQQIRMISVDNWQLASVQMPSYLFAAVDLTRLNTQMLKQCQKEIWGILGSDFLAHYQAIIDYNKLSLKLQIEG